MQGGMQKVLCGSGKTHGGGAGQGGLWEYAREATGWGGRGGAGWERHRTRLCIEFFLSIFFLAGGSQYF